MTLVKICGITNLNDAIVAAEAGADMLGFNFYPKSPRYISPNIAREIVDEIPERVIPVGVFVNESTSDEVRSIAVEIGLRAVQLHGDETPDFCNELSDYLVIKAFRTSPSLTRAEIEKYSVSTIMLDAYHSSAMGGTGQRADWEFAKSTASMNKKLILAGGLGASNVTAAIRMINPWAVDVCSSLETKPGKKNAAAVREFVKIVRAASE